MTRAANMSRRRWAESDGEPVFKKTGQPLEAVKLNEQSKSRARGLS